MKKINCINKIGGSSLQSIECFKQLQQLDLDTPSLLVVSATHKTTRKLQSCLDLAANKQSCDDLLDEIITGHADFANKLLTDPKEFVAHLQSDKEKVAALLHSINLVGNYSEKQQHWLLGFGEYWSSQLIAQIMPQKTLWLDAGKIITIHHHDSIVSVDWNATAEKLKQAVAGNDFDLIVAPGFVASDANGDAALLGWNGSDFSAAIFAKLLNAKKLIKWTDVDGIYSADPNQVLSAFAIEHLSYQEAAELAYFGTSVLHPQAVQPAIECNIPIYIKNFFKPEDKGTIIGGEKKLTDSIVKGLSSIGHVSLLNLEGTGMAGVCGIAARLFNALSEAEISVILISQASSEHSISFVISSEQAHHAQELLMQRFDYEIQSGMIQKVSITDNCSIVAAVGDGMQGACGVAAKFFNTLADANINILAIAQGSSERNISVVINSDDSQRALRSLHGGFYLANKTLSIGLVGPGGVGGQLLEQINENIERLKKDFLVDLRVRGVMNSKHMQLDEHAVDLNKWSSDKMSEPCDINAFANHIASPEIPHAVIIDCTSSQLVADNYLDFIDSGCHIVTPNKKANSSSYDFYQSLMQKAQAKRKHYLYETTVCAGLPNIKTIQELLATGDEIKRIEGIVSGTLAYIFNQCADGKSFADSVKDAYEQGYTEPDPRDDLNGLDVARKFVCMAREIGFNIELDEVELLDMVPEALRDVSVEEFLAELENHQQQIESQIKDFLQDNAAIAYVGIIENGKIKISLNAYPETHPFANTQGTDNILLIQSRRYDKQPLIIQGPGAGLDVTAAGVFADLLKLVSML